MNLNKNIGVAGFIFLFSFFVITFFSTTGLCLADICGTVETTQLIAGQHFGVGTVTISNDEDNLYITYEADGTWSITETHLDIATDPGQLKQTSKGNAIPGRFAYATNHDPGVLEVTHTIDLNKWPAGTQLYIAAHAVVKNGIDSETAWSEGTDFPGKNWAMYFGYDIQLCSQPPSNPGIIEFQEVNLVEMEGDTSVILTLNRSQGSDGIVTVDVYSTDISATAEEDYAKVLTTVTFNDGETSKQVEVFILNDQVVEWNEQFQVKLTNVVGAEIGPNDTATITIIDDDGVYY